VAYYGIVYADSIAAVKLIGLAVRRESKTPKKC